MTCEHPSRLFALYAVMLCATGAAAVVVQGAHGFERKALILLKVEPQNPKCFAGGMKDFTCFWEEDEEKVVSVDQYSFTYAYQNENSSICPLTAVPAAGGKLMFVCHMKRVQMFVQIDIRVHRQGLLIHNRSLQVDYVFLLDPPSNVTVGSTGQQGQLNVTWVPPPPKYKDDSMIYEVIYAPAGSHLGQVELARARSEVILRDLRAGTKYRVQVRVKPDGVTYSGYWSAWSDPVYMETLPAGIDPLIMSLVFIISIILVVLITLTLLSHNKFLLRKVWPTIPTPDGKFKGLFTVYGGNFQEWLGQTSGGLWLAPALVYAEECPSPLEVLSEFSMCPPLPFPPLPPKASRAISPNEDRLGLGESAMKTGRGADLTDESSTSAQDRWLLDRLRALHSQSSMPESQDTYITLSGNNRGSEGEHFGDPLEEALPLEVLFANRRKTLSESHSDLGSGLQSSGSEQLSNQSSFEFPNQVWTPNPGYTYMAVADSGVSMDYSPMSRAEDAVKGVIYANELPAQGRPLLLRQYHIHDDG